MAVYNGEKYLVPQLNSLVNQTRQADEVIIMDDCSTDRSVQIISSYIEEHHLESWKLIQKQSNQGWKQNFRDGFEQASGELIFPCDQDDIWHPDKIEKMAVCMDAHPGLELLAANYTVFFSGTDEGHGSRKYRENSRVMKNDGSLEIPELDPKWPYVMRPGCVYCFRKSFFESLKPVWDTKFAHDAILWRYARMDHALGILNFSVIDFRRHGDNATSNVSRTIESRVNVFREYIHFHEIAEKRVKSEKERRILERGIRFLEYRIQYFQTRNFLVWLKLAFGYQPYYLSFKGCLGDLYYVLKGR